MSSYLLPYISKRTFVDTNPNNNMRIHHWICYNLCKCRANTSFEINNKKGNTFTFQLLTAARFSEERVISRMISLLSLDEVDSIIRKVCSSSGLSRSIPSWVSSSFSCKNTDICISQCRSKSHGRLTYVFIGYLEKGGVILERERRSTIATLYSTVRAEMLHQTGLVWRGEWKEENKRLDEFLWD